MSAYQALVCTHWGHWSELELQELERPGLKPGQVRIRVHHAGVGFAVSLFVSGKYQRKPPLPFTPGTEAAGEIIELGPNVHHLQIGQRVTCAMDWGAFAQEAVVTAATVYPVLAGVPLSLAAAVPITYGTVWSALEWRAKLQKGQTILIHGAGGALGMAAVQIAHLKGARVIATASSEEKRKAAMANGAQHALPADAETLPALVKALCPCGGVDVVFDSVGGDLFDASLRCIASHGLLLVIGFASGRIAQIPSNLLLLKNVSVSGFNYGQYIGWGLTDERLHYAAEVAQVIEQVLQAIENKIMPIPMTQHFAFSDWKNAIDTTMSRRSVGKVILDF